MESLFTSSKNYIQFFLILIFLSAKNMAVAQLKGLSHSSRTSEEQFRSTNEGFLENKGQFTDMNGAPVPNVLFKAQAPGIIIWITKTGITYQTLKLETVENNASVSLPMQQLNWERIDMILDGAVIESENAIGEKLLNGSSDFYKPHCANGIRGVKRFETITIRNVYPGIDWKLYRKNSNSFKYDFIVHPGADYHQIKLVYQSKNVISLSEHGDLEFQTSILNFQEKAPVSFCKNKRIETAFTELSKTAIVKNSDTGFETAIGFQLDETSIDKRADLIIDPDLVWGTFISGSYSDCIRVIESTPTNEILMSGFSNSFQFPFVDPGNGAYFQNELMGNFEDCCILKFSSGGELIWSTFYGGNEGETTNSMVFDHSGNVYLTGETGSTFFPTFAQGINTYVQSNYGGGTYDAFILKFAGSGQLLWATLYGGQQIDCGNALAIDSDDNVFVGGSTNSGNFQTQALAGGGFFEPSNLGLTDAFILKFSNTGERLWSTYYGGSIGESINDMLCDNNDHLFVTGFSSSINFPTQSRPGAFNYNFQNGDYNSFILRFDENGNRIWSTILGGWFNDEAYSMVMDDDQNFYITGITDSPNFPLQNPGNGAYFKDEISGYSDVFLSKFNHNGALIYSTFFGGTQHEGMFHFHPFRSHDKLDIDQCGNLTMVFETESNDVPRKKPDSHSFFDNSFAGGYDDAFIARFCSSGQLLWATYLGGNGNDVHPSVEVDRSGNTYVSCYSSNPGFDPSTGTYPLKDPGQTCYYSAEHNEISSSFLAKFNNNTGQLLVDTIYTADCENDGGAKIKVSGLCLPLNYIWSNGTETLNTSSLSNTIIGLESGTYTVVVESACGMLTETIEVPYFCNPETETPIEKVEFPNVLTPNDDNINDLFSPIVASGLSEYELVITNRWGELVFTTNDPTFGWNGKYKDQLCSEGVYFWKAKYITLSGNEAIVSGNVTLIK